MARYLTYIPSPLWMLDLNNFNGFTDNPELWWKGIAKVSIKKVQKPKVYSNEIYPATVYNILTDFYLEAWEPIMVDDDFVLLDGQHRLKAAHALKLRYIDVILIPKASLESMP